MATATAIEIKRAQETADMARVLREINERLIRFEDFLTRQQLEPKKHV